MKDESPSWNMAAFIGHFAGRRRRRNGNRGTLIFDGPFHTESYGPAGRQTEAAESNKQAGESEELLRLLGGS